MLVSVCCIISVISLLVGLEADTGQRRVRWKWDVSTQAPAACVMVWNRTVWRRGNVTCFNLSESLSFNCQRGGKKKIVSNQNIAFLLPFNPSSLFFLLLTPLVLSGFDVYFCLHFELLKWLNINTQMLSLSHVDREWQCPPWGSSLWEDGCCSPSAWLRWVYKYTPAKQKLCVFPYMCVSLVSPSFFFFNLWLDVWNFVLLCFPSPSLNCESVCPQVNSKHLFAKFFLTSSFVIVLASFSATA